TDRAIPPSLRDGTDQPIFERSAGRRLRLARRPPASARSRPAAQSALDRAASAGHSYARSSGSPLDSEASATSASSVRTGWTTYWKLTASGGEERTYTTKHGTTADLTNRDSVGSKL